MPLAHKIAVKIKGRKKPSPNEILTELDAEMDAIHDAYTFLGRIKDEKILESLTRLAGAREIVARHTDD